MCKTAFQNLSVTKFSGGACLETFSTQIVVSCLPHVALYRWNFLVGIDIFVSNMCEIAGKIFLPLAWTMHPFPKWLHVSILLQSAGRCKVILITVISKCYRENKMLHILMTVLKKENATDERNVLLNNSTVWSLFNLE